MSRSLFQDGNINVGFRLFLIVGCLLVAVLGVQRLAGISDDLNLRFEAHEFAVFRSEYEKLKVQNPLKRVEHFHDLLDTTESARLTPGMSETLAEFCRKVATAEEESPSVRAEARLVLHHLEAKTLSRAPASVPSEK